MDPPTEPPTIMGQKLKRAEKLGIWYFHVWSESGNPSGLFADWNPNVEVLKRTASGIGRPLWVAKLGRCRGQSVK